MGRKRKNAAYDYFSYDKKTNISACLVAGCTNKINGQHGTNLLYHLSSKHPEEHKVVSDRNRMIQNEARIQKEKNNTSAANISSGYTAEHYEEDDLVDINQRLLAIEESRIDADMELARAMNRQASALEELVGLARTFVNIYERNNRQNDNSTNNEQQSMEQCQTSNQQDPEVLESIFLHIKKELPE